MLNVGACLPDLIRISLRSARKCDLPGGGSHLAEQAGSTARLSGSLLGLNGSSGGRRWSLLLHLRSSWSSWGSGRSGRGAASGGSGTALTGHCRCVYGGLIRCFKEVGIVGYLGW